MPHLLPQVCLPSASPVGAGTLTRLANDAIQSARLERSSSIDQAFDALLTVTQLAVEVGNQWRPQHGLILTSSAVAAAEDYFRSILTEAVVVCPLCAARVAPLETRMEFVFSSSVSDAVRGMLDRESFSSRETVMNWARKIAAMNLTDRPSLRIALEEYERVCHVRHCAMHSGGYVSSHNAHALDVPAGTWISFNSAKAIHEIISVVTATLRAFNQMLFETILSSWINENQLTGNWNDDKDRFTPLWCAFRSERDIASSRSMGPRPLRSNAYHSYAVIRKAIVARTQSP